jgi:hypothetical protein
VRYYGTESFFNDSESTSEASIPTRGGDAFVMRLTNNRRFSTLGLNLIFEGLLLGASLRLHVKGTGNPHKFGLSVHDAFIHPKGVFAKFCREA